MPKLDEPAHGYFVRLAGLNDQLSANVVASSFGLNGSRLQPAECLQFTLSLPVANKERLLLSTPQVSKATVKMFGETFRRRDWSVDKRYFCPACLAEDAYHRSYWDIVEFRHCPFHDLPLRCVDQSKHQVPWWSPSFEYSPFGSKIAEPGKRLRTLPTSIETYTLGRLGLIEKPPIALLDDLPTLASVFAAIEFSGRLVLGGFRAERPSLVELGKANVIKAGFGLLTKGNEAIKETLRGFVRSTERKDIRKQRGLEFLFGWAYPAAKTSLFFGPMFSDLMIEVAAAHDGLTRGVRDLEDVKSRIQLTDVSDLAEEFGITEERVRKIAALLGIRSSRSRFSDHYVAFTVDEVALFRDTVRTLIDRNRAAEMLDIPRSFFDGLVHLGLVHRFIRMKGPGCDMDRFRPEDVHLFAASYLSKAEKQHCLPADAQLLSQLQRTSRNNPAKLVQDLVTGGVPILGRLGDKFGTIIVPLQTRRVGSRVRTIRDTKSIGTLDAGAKLAVRHAVVLELRKLGYLKSCSQSPQMLDLDAFNKFCRKYISPRYYASILSCHPSYAGRRLAERGVKTIEIDVRNGCSHLVERASARRVLGLSSDPDSVADGSVDAFVEGLVKELSLHTTFKLSSLRDGPTFRTGKGTLHLKLAIDWSAGQLSIGPKYSKRRTGKLVADLLKRRQHIDAAFKDELSWIDSEKSLSIIKSMKRVPYGSTSSWPAIYAEIVEKFQQFKTHFEPPQRRY